MIKIYCLAVPDRLKYIKSVLFGHYKFKRNQVTFVKPYLKNDLNCSDLKKKGILTQDCKLNSGEIACYLGHLKILRIFLRSKHDYCLVLEDDIQKTKNPEQTVSELNNIVSNLPRNFDLLYVSRGFSYCKIDTKYSKVLNQTYYSLTTASYIISKKGAEKILSNKPKKISFPIDVLYAGLSFKKKIRSFTVKKNIFNQKRTKKGKLRSQLNHDNYMKVPVCFNYKQKFNMIKDL